MNAMNAFAFVASANALVIQEKTINESGPHYIHLKGRKGGLLSKLLSMLGIDDTTTFDVYEDRIEFASGSVFGRTTEVIPLSAVCNVGTGYVKPVALLVFGILCILSGLMSMFVPNMQTWLSLITLLIGAAAFAGYFLGKTMMVYARSTGADLDVIAFKRSVIENLKIDDEEAKRIVLIMNSLVLKANRRDNP